MLTVQKTATGPVPNSFCEIITDIGGRYIRALGSKDESTVIGARSLVCSVTFRARQPGLINVWIQTTDCVIGVEQDNIEYKSPDRNISILVRSNITNRRRLLLSNSPGACCRPVKIKYGETQRALAALLHCLFAFMKMYTLRSGVSGNQQICVATGRCKYTQDFTPWQWRMLNVISNPNDPNPKAGLQTYQFLINALKGTVHFLSAWSIVSLRQLPFLQSRANKSRRLKESTRGLCEAQV